MQTNNVSTNSGAGGAEKPRGSNALGKDEFVKLLMAQLGNQDPTEPMDNSAFVAQLAQFANVEQLQLANNTLEGMLVAQAANNQTATASLVGKEIVFRSESISLEAGRPAPVMADLARPATEVTAVVMDSSGKTVRTLQLGAQNGGTLNFDWDGRDDSGDPLPPGNYTVRVTAKDVGGESVTVDQRARSTVTGVSFAKGYAELMIAGSLVKMSDVVEILQAK